MIAKVFMNRIEEKCPSVLRDGQLPEKRRRTSWLWILNSDIERYKDGGYNTYRHGAFRPPDQFTGTVAIEGVLWPSHGAHMEQRERISLFLRQR